MTVELNVNVQVGVSPEVAQLIAGLLHTSKAAIQAASEQPAEAPAPAAPAAKRGRKTKTDQAATQEPAHEAEAAEQVEAAAQEPAPEAEQKELTEEDVRAAMHRTRQRIEGEDYKENTDSELYKKYHKALTAQFKQIASLLGADKPSTLPADKRSSFIQQCDELIVKDGNITVKVPY